MSEAPSKRQLGALLALIGGCATVTLSLVLGGPLLHHVPGADAWTWHPPEGVATVRAYGLALNGLLGGLLGGVFSRAGWVRRRCATSAGARRLAWVMVAMMGVTVATFAGVQTGQEASTAEVRTRGVRVGDTIPDFTLSDASGAQVTRDALLGKGPVVLYFYPKDETKGCTMQACAFRDQYTVFTDAGAEVVGVSSDSAELHQAFTDHHDLPFVLLADPDNSLRRAFGVPKSLGLVPGRVTYVTDKSGVVHHMVDSQLDVLTHISEALDVVKRLSTR
jgi:peroxiredoxin Q/BCP